MAFFTNKDLNDKYHSHLEKQKAEFQQAGKLKAMLAEREREKATLPEGWAYTLPTEAQWEYAYRAGEPGPYWGEELDKVGWHKDNSEGKAHEVGEKKPNAWGLHDMHGNVREWCPDWFAEKLTGGKDPAGPDRGSHRVVRGGSWLHNARICRSSFRNHIEPGVRGHDAGFRVCLIPEQ